MQLKKVFIVFEKPVAVDAPGVRKVIELAKKAKEKNLGFMSGFWRDIITLSEIFSRILGGAIGDLHALYSTYNGGEVWKKTREDDWGDLEAQIRNWNAHYGFRETQLLSKPFIALMMQWAMGEEAPISAEGSGGRQVYDDLTKYGNIYDHFACVYQWANGAKGYHFSRQQNGTVGSYGSGTFRDKGSCSAKNRHAIISENDSWRYRGENNDMYQTEHNELFASIRNGNPFNDGEISAKSTMVAIMGRMASYTGQKD